MTLLFVYGTLKQGGSNHAALRSARFVKATRTAYPIWDMQSMGAYPVMQSARFLPGAMIGGEVYWVSRDLLSTLDRMEGNGHFFNRQQISVAEVTDRVDAYVLPKHLRDIGWADPNRIVRDRPANTIEWLI